MSEATTPSVDQDAFEEFAKSLEAVEEAKATIGATPSSTAGLSGITATGLSAKSLTKESIAAMYARLAIEDKKRRAVYGNELKAYKSLFESSLISAHGSGPFEGSFTTADPSGKQYMVGYARAPKTGWDQATLAAIADATSGTPKIEAKYAPAKGYEDDAELAPAKEVVGSTFTVKVKEL